MAQKGTTGAWLAKKIGVTKATISNWRTNKKQPPLHQIHKMAVALERKPSEFINDDYKNPT